MEWMESDVVTYKTVCTLGGRCVDCLLYNITVYFQLILSIQWYSLVAQHFRKLGVRFNYISVHFQ
jgi:hypothetical protein